jgi:hypothetical protein
VRTVPPAGTPPSTPAAPPPSATPPVLPTLGPRITAFGTFGDTAGFSGLRATFYNLAKAPGGTPLPDEGLSYWTNVLQFVNEANWDDAFLERYFFRAPETGILSRILFDKRPSSQIAKAFGETNGDAPVLVLCKGTVKAPFSGRVRFVGTGDDILVVRWNKEIILDCGSRRFHSGKLVNNGTLSDASWQSRLRSGKWLNVTQDTQYKLEILFGGAAGGDTPLSAILCFEREDNYYDAPNRRPLTFGHPVPAPTDAETEKFIALNRIPTDSPKWKILPE